jgi:hypothetical protein
MVTVMLADFRAPGFFYEVLQFESVTYYRCEKKVRGG